MKDRPGMSAVQFVFIDTMGKIKVTLPFLLVLVKGYMYLTKQI